MYHYDIHFGSEGLSLCNVWFDWCSRICRVNCISTVSNETHYIIFRSVVDPLGSGFQIIQSLLAIGPGGLFGLGLGQSRQKFLYLPEPQTDFIFAILSEELGFIGGSFVLLLFSLLLWRGIRIALGAPDLYGTFLAVGIVAMIAIQVMINVGVVTGLMPVTGITLPFLSYGGSSLTLMLMAVGVLLNISRHSRY